MASRTLGQIIAQQEVISMPPASSVSSAAQRMAQARVGAMLVVEDGKLLGIFTERDLLVRVVARKIDPEKISLAETMTANPPAAPPEMPLSAALVMMYEGCYRHLPVVENGRLLGMVSARDALGKEILAFESTLEEREQITEMII